jgi:HlyD family secretion protein
MNGGMDIIVSRIPDAISIPSKAVFTRNGKPVVYLAAESGYRPVEVEVIARNPDEVAVTGISEGSDVALREPETQEAVR